MAASVPFVAHIEVWTLVVGAVGLGWYAAKVLQPKAVAAGYQPISGRQVLWYIGAVLGMWAISDWPIHEIAEQHLYFVHMIQHLFLSMLVPAMFLLATPRWLFELILSPDSLMWRWLRTGSRPVVAWVLFNGLTALLHWSKAVQLSYESGAFHFGLHLMIFVAGLLMWMPVISPVREWRIAPLAQCIYLFAMSIVPTVPSGWLIFADNPVYRHYDVPDRLWGIDVLADQNGAGVIMKIVGGFFLWGVIFVIFMRWAHAEMKSDEQIRDRVLTYKQVSDQFDQSPAAGDPNTHIGMEP